MSRVLDIDAASFEREVLEASAEQPVVVDFWAPWCGPCRALGPVLEQLVDEADGAFKLVKINTDDAPELAQRWGVQGIPAVKAFRDGELVDEFVGALPASQVREWLAKLIPSEADLAVEAGFEALDQERYAQAGDHFADALDEDPRHPHARLGAASAALALDDPEQARAHLDRLEADQRARLGALFSKVDLAVSAALAGGEDTLQGRLASDPDDHEARIALGQQRAVAGKWEQAFEAWLEVVRRDQGAWREQARRAMIEGFDAVEEREVRDRWQRKLTMLLF